MNHNWKVQLDRMLMDGNIEVFTTGMLWNATDTLSTKPSRASFVRWLATSIDSGRLRKVRAGLFLNAVGNKGVSVGAAAGYIKRFAIPSLSWVLEQDWLMNNFGDVVTCVVPMGGGITVPNLTSVKTGYGEFRFRAIPLHVYEFDCVPAADWRDARYAHPRATPEKALCDWIYLARSPHSPVSRPPFDIELERLDQDRLGRLAGAMGISPALQDWLTAKHKYDRDPDVVENTSIKTKTKLSVSRRR